MKESWKKFVIMSRKALSNERILSYGFNMSCGLFRPNHVGKRIFRTQCVPIGPTFHQVTLAFVNSSRLNLTVFKYIGCNFPRESIFL